MSRMAIRCAVLLCISLVALAPECFAGFTVLSGEQRVWGIAGATYYNYPAPTVNIGHTYESGVRTWDGSTLSGGVQVGPDIWASSYVGALLVGAASEGYGARESAGAVAKAEGRWVFRPHGTALNLQIDVWNLWEEDPLTMELTDTTAAKQLYYHNSTTSGYTKTTSEPWPYESGRDFPLIEVFSVDPTHIYEMHLYMESSSSSDGPYSGFVKATVPIPAPGAMVLGLFGSSLVVWLRRRKRV